MTITVKNIESQPHKLRFHVSGLNASLYMKPYKNNTIRLTASGSRLQSLCRSHLGEPNSRSSVPGTYDCWIVDNKAEPILRLITSLVTNCN